MSKFFKIIKNSISKNIDNYTTIRTGKITADNGDGTYDVKIANASNAMPDIETMYYDDVFSIGEIVDIGFEYGSKESPKIMGHAKKIAQDPKEVEVDYSGGGVQTETVSDYGFATIADGQIQNSGAVYANVYNDDGSGINILVITGREEEGNIISIGQAKVFVGDYVIHRGYLYFDTSAIPVGATITAAILSIYLDDDNSATDFYVVIQNGQPNYPNLPLIASDFNYTKYSNNGGQITTSGISISAYVPITLNSNGIAWINKGGTTKFCLRSSRDIASVVPGGEERINIYSADKGGDYRPKLTITYTI